jgi:hypothetical protein
VESVSVRCKKLSFDRLDSKMVYIPLICAEKGLSLFSTICAMSNDPYIMLIEYHKVGMVHPDDE